MEKVTALNWLRSMKDNCEKAKHYNDPHRIFKAEALDIAINLLIEDIKIKSKAIINLKE